MQTKEIRKSVCSTVDNHDENITFDDILDVVGSNGPYQRRFNYLFNFVCCMIVSMTYLNNIIVLAIPEHWCYVPGRSTTNHSLETWKLLTLPVERDARGEESLSKCFMYNYTSKESWLTHDIHSANTSNKPEIVGCQHGWMYNDTWYKKTAPSSQDWVCDRELYATNSLVLGRIGDVIGTFIFGQLGDTMGRRPVFYMTLVTLVFGRLMMTFTASNYWWFGVASIIGSLTCTAVFQAPVVIAMEISRTEDRARIAMTQCFSWTLASCIMPLIMWGVGDWVIFMLITTLPALLFLATFNFMVESPRWLLSRGRPEKCVMQLKKIARVNKTIVPDDALDQLLKIPHTSSSYGMIGLISSVRLIRNTFILIFVSMATGMSYYTLILNISNMGGNPFMNFLYQAAAELPGYILGQKLCDHYGRRFTQLLAYTSTFLAAVIIVCVIGDPDLAWMSVPLAAVIKFFISFAFFVVNLQTIEIYPTCIRQSGTAMCVIMAAAIGVVAPYIVYLGTVYSVRLPYIVISLVILAAGIVGSFLPETLNHELPETLEESEVFGMEQSYWQFIPKSKQCSEDKS